MRGFLLDSHVTRALIPGVQRAAPDCEIVHLADWHGGAYLHEEDEVILAPAYHDDLVLVTFDVTTIPEIVYRWMDEGRPSAGVVCIAFKSRRTTDVGGLARTLCRLYTHPERLEPAHPIIYAGPIPIDEKP